MKNMIRNSGEMKTMSVLTLSASLRATLAEALSGEVGYIADTRIRPVVDNPTDAVNPVAFDVVVINLDFYFRNMPEAESLQVIFRFVQSATDQDAWVLTVREDFLHLIDESLTLARFSHPAELVKLLTS